MITLKSADRAPWNKDDGFSHDDGLAVRKSGPQAREKHKHLTYYGKIFATSMKNKFENRVYIELFAGLGPCKLQDHAEGSGTLCPLR